MAAAQHAVFALVLASSTLTAQLSVSATGDMSASFSAANTPAGSQSIPTGTLTSGTSITSGTASTTYTATTSSASCQISLVSAAPDMTSYQGAFNTWSQTRAAGHATVLLTSAVPLDVDVAVFIARGIGMPCRGNDASVDAGPLGSWSTAVDCPFDPSNFFPCEFNFATTIDATGRTFTLSTNASGVYQFTGHCGTAFPASSSAAIVITPRTAGFEFGNPCGMTLSSTADLLDPAIEILVIEDPTPLPIGVLLVGSGQVAVPMPWGCDLHINPLFSVALSLNAQGQRQIRVRRPPLGVFTLQAATFDFVTAHMSNGVGF